MSVEKPPRANVIDAADAADNSHLDVMAAIDDERLLRVPLQPSALAEGSSRPPSPTTTSTALLIPTTLTATPMDASDMAIRFGVDQTRIVNANRQVSSAGKGILIGMLSAFSSAVFVAILFAAVYLLRNTRKGRIILDRIGRPGEYDDEQTFARDEAEALERMDDLQRAEYLRAKGACLLSTGHGVGIVWMHGASPALLTSSLSLSLSLVCRLRRGEPTRVDADRHIPFAVLGHPRKGRVGLGV